MVRVCVAELFEAFFVWPTIANAGGALGGGGDGCKNVGLVQEGKNWEKEGRDG